MGTQEIAVRTGRSGFRRAFGLGVAAMLLALPLALAAQGPTACVRSGASAPAIDGIVAAGVPSPGCPSDPVWAGIAPAELQPGGSLPRSHLFLTYDSTTSIFYVGITAHGDEDLSSQDFVSFFFDADNSDTWNAGDFMIRVQARPTGSDKIENGVACNQPVGEIAYFQWTGSGWQQNTTLPGTIQARIAYDFDTGGDPDDKLWNLELSIPPAFGMGTNFALGVFAFLDDGAQQAPQLGTVRKWPGSITNTPGIAAVDPAFSAPNPAELANVDLAPACFDVNFAAAVPWRINSAAAQAFGNHIVRDAVNTFTPTFFFDGPGTTPAAMPNQGTVRLRLRPYGTGASGSQYNWEKTIVTSADTMNAEKSVTFSYDLANPPGNWSDFTQINFICATMILEGFQRDDILTNNSLNVNYNEFTTSEFRQPVFIMADEVPGVRDGELVNVLLRSEMRNETAAALGVTGGRRIAGMPRGALGLLSFGGIFLVVGLAATARGRRGGSRAFLALGLLLVVGSAATCTGIQIVRPGGVERESARWSFANAEEVGLRPVEGQPGWYTLPVRVGEPVELDLHFQGMPLPYETRRLRLPAVEEGQPGTLRIPVRQGQVLAFFAEGAVDLDGPDGRLEPVSANGMVMERSEHRFLMRDGRYRGSENAGALIGSFDGFRTSFPVGRSTALVVPQQATELVLAVNLATDMLQVVTGGFEISVVERPPLQVPTYPTVQGDGTFAAPARVNTWDVLTSLSIYTFHETIERDERRGVVSRTRHPLGFAHQVIFDSHR